MIRRATAARKDERGQVAVFVLGMFLVVTVVIGVAVDGTKAFLLRRTLQNAADGAATAAVSEIDIGAAYRSGGRQLKLDPDRARRVALGWVHERGLRASRVVVTPTTADVVVHGSRPTTFLRLVGIHKISAAARARARPQPGLPTG